MRDAKLNSVGKICISLVVLKKHSNVSYKGGAIVTVKTVATHYISESNYNDTV